MSDRIKKLQSLTAKYSLEEIKTVLNTRELEEMNTLSGQRVLGFLLSLRNPSANNGQIKYDYLYADKSINGKRCLLNLGKVFIIDQAETAIKEKLKNKISKDKKWKQFLET